MVVFVCANCGKTLEVTHPPDAEAIPCPRCGQSVPISQRETTQLATQPTQPVPVDVAPVSPTIPSEWIEFLSPAQGPGELGRLGHYRVLKVIGSGGMGVVFLAEDTHLKRPVALKCLLPVLSASSSARQRFLREAQAAAAIEHEHIVVIYQVGQDRGIPFLAMQLLQGESLESRLQRQAPLPVPEILRIGREIAEGLAAAHARGLIHRDVKPENLWLESPRGRVKILDFGLARAVLQATAGTQQGTVIGTPAYMAPEQAGGKPIDARCDLFSLGCVLYRMATGKVPFTGPDTMAVLLALACTDPVPPSQHNPTLPPQLSALILQLLAKETVQRPTSAQKVVEELTMIEKQLTSPGPPEPAPTRSSRLPMVVAIALSVLMLAGAFALVVSMIGRTPEGARPGASPPGRVEIGISYGTEKKNWLNAAATAFAETPEGKDVTIRFFPQGSIEGAQAISKEEDRRINVWAPASSLYRDHLVRGWKQKHPTNPILREETLAVTPLVFVFWEDRYRAFIKKYGIVSFKTLGRALEDKDGWGAIAGQPEWGTFKFGHTNPVRSNSGLMTLLLMAAEHKGSTRRLSVSDVTDRSFQSWVKDFEKSTFTSAHSTGTLMEDMLRRNPPVDAVCVYENLAIDYFKLAEARGGKLHVAYPEHTLVSDNPYYILDVPWSTPAQRRAADAFLRFLLSEPMQREAVAHGFRPGNVSVLLPDTADSPFKRHQSAGLRLDLRGFMEPPQNDVLDALLHFWEQLREP
jgi:serine/threonine protein kinase